MGRIKRWRYCYSSRMGKTEEDLEKFADEYANRNISVGYDLLDEPMDQDEFLEQVTSAYVDAGETWIR